MSDKEQTKFEVWLADLDLPVNKKEFINNNIELFNIVFDAGYEEAVFDESQKIFKEIDIFHDVVVDSTGHDLSNEKLKQLYYCLPDFFQGHIEKEGFYNLKDDLYVYFEKNGLPKDFVL